VSVDRSDVVVGEREHVVAKAGELDEGERIVVLLEGREVGVFNINGDYVAYTNWCAHQGGPLCEGSLTGTVEGSFDRDTLEVELDWCREGEILSCPWHGWEFDATNGDCLSDSSVRLRSYDVRVEDGFVVVSL
jgi:nitrite reductase/ring-hydroxylating ferredoxin subunit